MAGIAFPNDNCSILSLLAQESRSLSFKYPGININGVYGKYLRATNKPILDSQTKFKEVSNKIVKEIF
ncbi:hypothetical protein RhiirA4_479122 [Rhizophagus irregularis]|uniref:Uncharacterized protein n=1 Tax=Rhizophagus irregularis TaxID=588596 RepID=A0A2I1HFY2_9GLOM|nr:hypothetical protein RhiirA4_479122 [Rhizophagus irregularis]